MGRDANLDLSVSVRDATRVKDSVRLHFNSVRVERGQGSLRSERSSGKLVQTISYLLGSNRLGCVNIYVPSWFGQLYLRCKFSVVCFFIFRFLSNCTS